MVAPRPGRPPPPPRHRPPSSARPGARPGPAPGDPSPPHPPALRGAGPARPRPQPRLLRPGLAPPPPPPPPSALPSPGCTARRSLRARPRRANDEPAGGARRPAGRGRCCGAGQRGQPERELGPADRGGCGAARLRSGAGLPGIVGRWRNRVPGAGRGRRPGPGSHGATGAFGLPSAELGPRCALAPPPPDPAGPSGPLGRRRRAGPGLRGSSRGQSPSEGAPHRLGGAIRARPCPARAAHVSPKPRGLSPPRCRGGRTARRLPVLSAALPRLSHRSGAGTEPVGQAIRVPLPSPSSRQVSRLPSAPLSPVPVRGPSCPGSPILQLLCFVRVTAVCSSRVFVARGSLPSRGAGHTPATGSVSASHTEGFKCCFWKPISPGASSYSKDQWIPLDFLTMLHLQTS
ncbi:uncharacterized protein LOC115599849 [Calypte anna]|uniref:uncharacterized protein LOC115599849 n=1 Tax=Calypte anna TaxID=9244 RepID=UPI0011C47FAD|nr:uncharacterized protein LOC115599849 [Calypte anna]